MKNMLCKWCSTITNNTDLECVECRELRTRIKRDPKLASIFLDAANIQLRADAYYEGQESIKW